MRRLRRTLAPLLFGAIVVFAACSSTSGPANSFENPSTIRVNNNVGGPILFFFARPCGTTDWGPDLLPLDPVEGTIQPGNSKDFTVEAGCYDLRADHLETTDPGIPVTKQLDDQVASPLNVLEWTVEEIPGGTN